MLLAAGSWWRFGSGPQIAAVAAVRGTAVEIVYATGGVEPVHWAKVASVIRDRIIEICDCEGRTVAKGDVLVRLDGRDVEAGLKELKAREDFLKREMSRVSELIIRGAATSQAQERAAMDLQTVQGLISVQTEKIADYTIVAPMDGVVLRRDGEVGEIAEAGQILFRIGVPKPLQVVAEVNEEDIPRVALGETALFRTDAFPEQRLEGKVSDITPMGDVAAKTFRVKIAWRPISSLARSRTRCSSRLMRCKAIPFSSSTARARASVTSKSVFAGSEWSKSYQAWPMASG